MTVEAPQPAAQTAGGSQSGAPYPAAAVEAARRLAPRCRPREGGDPIAAPG